MRKKPAFLLCLLAAIPFLASAQSEVDPSTGYPYSWEELRAMDEFDYESRWDDLNLLRMNYWISAEEAGELLGISGLALIKEEGSNTLRYVLREGKNEYPLLRLEYHILGVIEKVQHEEKGILDAIKSNGKQFFEPLDLGTVSDLRAYWRKDRGWIYLMPEKGMSYFVISYYKTNRETVQYLKDMNSPDPRAEIGKKFMQYFVRKYDEKL